MNRKNLHSLSRFAVLGLALTIPASAGIAISVYATSPGGTSSESGSSDTSLGAAVRAFGSAYRDTGDSGRAFVEPGTGTGPCLFEGVFNVASQGCAEVDAGVGMLRAGAFAQIPDSGAYGQAMIDDTVTFLSGTATFEVRLDFDLAAFGSGDAAIVFQILRATGISDEPYSCIYCFGVNRDGWELTKFSFPFPIVTSGQGNPGPIDDVVSFTQAQPLSVRFLLMAEAFCGEEGLPCSAVADAQHTAYIGIPTPYTSSSGYSYLGFPTADVPEPGAFLLSLVGLAGLYARRQRTA